MGASCNIIQTLPNRNRVFRQRKRTFHDVRFGAQNIFRDNDSKEMQVQYIKWKLQQQNKSFKELHSTVIENHKNKSEISFSIGIFVYANV